MSNTEQGLLFTGCGLETQAEEAERIQSARSGSFVDNMRLPINRWFRYSAGFSAEWAESVIRELGQNGSVTILDPFAGSGTTMLAAAKARARSYGYESHPFVCRIANAKLLWWADHRLFIKTATHFLNQVSKASPPSRRCP